MDNLSGPLLRDKCPYKKDTEERHREKRDSRVKTEAVTGVTLPQAKEVPELGET